MSEFDESGVGSFSVMLSALISLSSSHLSLQISHFSLHSLTCVVTESHHLYIFLKFLLFNGQMPPLAEKFK